MGRPVFHGTAWAYKPDIENDGICPPPGHGPGVRLHFDLGFAMSFARAYAAWHGYREKVKPKGLIVGAVIDESRIRLDRKASERPERHGKIYRVAELRPSEILLKGVDFPELEPLMIGSQEAAQDALELFEEITGRELHLPFRARERRSQGGLLVPFNAPV